MFMALVFSDLGSHLYPFLEYSGFLEKVSMMLGGRLIMRNV